MELEIGKQDLINKALEKYTTIYPCVDKTSLADCFTMSENILCFWFNSEDDDTHMISYELQANN